MKSTIKIYTVTILCAALAIPIALHGAAAPQKLEEFERYSELPADMQQDAIVRAAEIQRNFIVEKQSLINYIREHYPFTLERILQHQSYVFSANFSPNGARVVTASEDYTAKIWNALTGQLLHTLQHQDWVMSANFSPDENRIVTACIDHTAKIWNALTGQLLRTLQHQKDVNFANFSPDGNRVVTVCADHTAKIWDANTGQLLQTLQHQKQVYSANFSPDGNRIVTACADHTAQIWNVLTGQLLYTIPHQSNVIFANFSPDGTLIVTACADRTAKIWNPKAYKLLHIFQHQNGVMSANFSPDGNHIVTASQDHTAKIWNANTGQLLQTLQHQDSVNFANFNPDENRIATACGDRTAKIWGPEPTEQFIEWIKNYATFNQVLYLASELNIPGATPHTFNADQIRLLFTNEQGSGFKQTMNDEQFNFLTTVLHIIPPAGIRIDVLQTNLQQRKDVLAKLITYLRNIETLSKAKEPFIEWLQKHATSHQLTYIANKLGVPEVPMRVFTEKEIKKLWQLKGSGFALEMDPDIYKFLTDELEIQNPTSQTPEDKTEQDSRCRVC